MFFSDSQGNSELGHNRGNIGDMFCLLGGDSGDGETEQGRVSGGAEW